MQTDADRLPVAGRGIGWTQLVVVLVVAACLKAAVMWIVLPVAAEKGIVPSAGTSHDLYLDIAQNLASGHGFRITPETSETMMRNPGYPYFLAGLIRVFGDNLAAIQLSNIVFGLGTAIIVFVLTRRFTGNAVVSLLCAAVFTFHPAVLLLETRAGVESMFTFLLAVFMLVLYRALDSGTLRDFFIAGLVLGLTLLTRTTPLLTIGLLFLYLLVVHRHSHPWKRAVTQTGVLVIGALLVLSPWMLRNYNLSGKPTFSESLAGVAAVQGLYVTKTMDEGKSYKARIHEARQLQSELAAAGGVRFVQLGDEKYVAFWDLFYSIDDELKYNRILLHYALDEFRQDPALFVKHCLYNGVRFWFQGTSSKITLMGAIIMVPLLLLSIAGLVLGLRQGLKLVPLTLPVIGVFAIALPLVSNARYAIPLIPLLLVFVGVALNRMLFAGSGSSSSAAGHGAARN